ncbi:MAG: class I SAM-dependent methyltransferase [Ignavibacteriae bacterium]|nr:class I SAM-dependent methyltransferase [Ignavibacteriota bacterium]
MADEHKQNIENQTWDFKEFTEHDITNRLKLSYNWLPEGIDNLLDGGCSYGYGTRFFRKKSKNVYGIDLNPKHIEIAVKRYTDINFKCCSLEHTEFESNFFDAIVINDVLEHTHDKIQTLNEMHRILKPGGTIIISTPHKGLFTFLDPYNYGYYLRKCFPWLYKVMYKIIRLIKERTIPKEFNPEHQEKHFHYSLRNYKKMLNQSGFSGNFIIEKVFRSGLLIEVFTMNLESFLKIIIPMRIVRVILKPFYWLSQIDYWIPYGKLAYNIAVKIIKK